MGMRCKPCSILTSTFVRGHTIMKLQYLTICDSTSLLHMMLKRVLQGDAQACSLLEFLGTISFVKLISIMEGLETTLLSTENWSVGE